MLPCSRFVGQRPQRTSETQALTVGTYFEKPVKVHKDDADLIASLSNPDFWLS